MITREEAKVFFDTEFDGEDTWLMDITLHSFEEFISKLFDQQDQFQQHIKSLEAQLANTEQLTCDGCIDFNGSVCTDLDWCKRDNRLQDNFKSKDTQ